MRKCKDHRGLNVRTVPETDKRQWPEVFEVTAGFWQDDEA